MREIKEFYGDYIAVGNHLFSFNIDQCAQPGSMWRRDEFVRVVDGLVAVMLALRKRPVIRYSTCKKERGSEREIEAERERE